MTHAECEIVANAGVQLREIAERLTLPASRLFEPAQFELVKCMDAAALSISEVYGQLSALPLETEPVYQAIDGDPGTVWRLRWVKEGDAA